MGIRVEDFRDHIVIPTLTWLGRVIPFSPYAVNQLLGTAAQESHMGFYLDQTSPGPGPGFGPYQMERDTYLDHCDWMIRYQKALWEKYQQVRIPLGLHQEGATEMQGNLYLATFMTRVHYYRIRQLMPTNLRNQAEQWKKYYNTSQGRGTVEEYMRNYSTYVGAAGPFPAIMEAGLNHV